MCSYLKLAYLFGFGFYEWSFFSCSVIINCYFFRSVKISSNSSRRVPSLSTGIQFGPTPRKSSKMIRDSRLSSRAENEKIISSILFMILKTNIAGKKIRRKIGGLRVRGRGPDLREDQGEAAATIRSLGNLSLT